MPAIGDTLREARMRQRLDIGDVERRTKIRAKYLRALENEEFSMLPGPTFVKTFLRTYSEALGLDPHLLVEEYRATYESREEVEHLQPLGPPGVGRDRRRAGPRGPRGPWLLTGLVAAAVIGTLLVLGLVSGDDGGPDGERAAEPTETQTERRRTQPERPPPKPTRVVLRIAPVSETYVCIDTGLGTDVRFEGTLTAPQTFRGRRLRVNLGNTSVEITKNRKPFPIEPSTEPVGFLFTPARTRPLPLGGRPCA